MIDRLRRVGSVETARTVTAIAREKRVSVLAAGLAYHAFNSLIPAVILGVLLLSTVGGFRSLFELFTLATGVQTNQFVAPIRRATSQSSGQLRALLIAGVVFLWSSGRLFEAIQRTFTEVYDGDGYDSTVEKLRDIAIAAATLLLGTVLAVGLWAWLVYVTRGWLYRLLAPITLLAVLVPVFLPMYYLFPRVDVSLREALPGAVFSAVVWVVSAIGFSLYARMSQSVQLYGVAGGVLLLLTWMFVVGLALPVGTILNAVVSDDWYALEAPD